MHVLTFGFFIGLWLLASSLQAQDGRNINLKNKNQISADWLVFKPAHNRLTLYLPDYHGPVNALYQWVYIRPEQPFRINFTAREGLCIFIDNQLIFTADSVASYEVDLTKLIINKPDALRQHLLCIWHPGGQLNYQTFRNAVLTPQEAAEIQVNIKPVSASISIQPKNIPNQNVFILFLLLIGLMYGSLRTTYTSDFYSIFRLNTFLRSSSLEEGFLAKPISSWSSILFVIAFSLSFALVIVAIHTNVQNNFIFNRLFLVSEADITSKIVFYTFLIFVFILVKYIFLRVMGIIFGLKQLVMTQYREFLRTTLFMGLFFPLIMLLYLVLNTANPQLVLFVSNIAVASILIFTVLRIFYTLNKKVSLRNLHLFSYICATEVIPLIILIKLIVFTY
ncbi:DUF4271 domain-containing protein [Adhaeribacter swui]|uniref:DUF4271 domain-containing protein n=1 Tax=Adhaeribacter swui TaxID=2086471 RepID=A0A7G7GF18_9BACT|nr:DUF4271 domain-containing protein [Adhaeribacter swui]